MSHSSFVFPITPATNGLEIGECPHDFGVFEVRVIMYRRSLTMIRRTPCLKPLVHWPIPLQVVEGPPERRLGPVRRFSGRLPAIQGIRRLKEAVSILGTTGRNRVPLRKESRIQGGIRHDVCQPNLCSATSPYAWSPRGAEPHRASERV